MADRTRRSILPAFLEPATKALVDELGEAVQARLGLEDLYWVVVTMGKYPSGNGFVYDLGIASDATPLFARAMRRCFPRTRQPDFRAWLGDFGDLRLEGVTEDRLRAALARVPDIKLP